MRTRAAFLVGVGVGFLVGTPAGRRQIERIAARANALLGEDGPWSGSRQEQPAHGVTTGTVTLSSKVVDAARAAARAAAAVAPKVIVRPVPPRAARPPQHEMSYRMPSQRSDPDREQERKQERDGDGQASGDGQARGPIS
ncbi:MAG TPA: hypothetical protein VF413_00545 [Cellulomonas sp.]